MKWLEVTFLGYLDEWEVYANSQIGISEKERAKLMLSRETIEGLRITGKSMHDTHVCIINIHNTWCYIL